MKAFLVVPDPAELWLALADNRSPASLPFLDRSLVQHAIESLVSRDVKEIEVIAFIAADQVRALVQSGTRWGAAIHVTGSRNWSEICELISNEVGAAPVVVANAEKLPDLAKAPMDRIGIFCDPSGSTGWAVVSPLDCAAVPGLIRGEIPEGWPRLDVPSCISASTPAEYLASWRRVVSREMPLLVQTGRDRGPGAVVGRGARVDAGATLTAPCYIGENTVVGKGCQIGPNGYVSSNCILEESTQVSDAVVLPSSYVGPHLDLRQKIVARSSILDIVRELVVPVTDDFLFGSTHPTPRQAPRVLERTGAFAAAVILSPIWAVGYLAGRLAPLEDGEIGYSSPTKDLFCRTLPGLLTVAAGKARLVGAPNLSSQAVQAMEPDVRRALGAVPKGIVSETYLLYGPRPTDDDLWASSAFLAAGKTLGSASEVFKRYLKMALSGKRANWQS